jgi:hypothetical protein
MSDPIGDPIGEYALKRSTDKHMEKFREYPIENIDHKKFVQIHNHGLASNLVQATFTDPFVKKQVCPCGQPAKQRCHKLGHERPKLLMQALKSVQPDITVRVDLYDILVDFIRRHNSTTLDFKCVSCHKEETSSSTLNDDLSDDPSVD